MPSKKLSRILPCMAYGGKVFLILRHSKAVQGHEFYRENPKKKQKIKLEIDVDPPANSHFEYSYLDFPLDFEVCHQDLSSNFALKIHALLCRPFLKGRDWYDFNWYVKQNTSPNLPHLQSALFQWGPWKGKNSMKKNKDL